MRSLNIRLGGYYYKLFFKVWVLLKDKVMVNVIV